MALVPAQCTKCGANLEVDDTQEAAVCKFCGTPFIVEKAINNYNVTNNFAGANVNIVNGNIDNFIEIAISSALRDNYQKAKEYVYKAYEFEPSNKTCDFLNDLIDYLQLSDDENRLFISSNNIKTLEKFCSDFNNINEKFKRKSIGLLVNSLNSFVYEGVRELNSATNENVYFNKLDDAYSKIYDYVIKKENYIKEIAEKYNCYENYENYIMAIIKLEVSMCVIRQYRPTPVRCGVGLVDLFAAAVEAIPRYFGLKDEYRIKVVSEYDKFKSILISKNSSITIPEIERKSVK